MTYGTLRTCGVVVCDDIWDTMGVCVVVYTMTYGTLRTCGVVVCDDIWDTMDKSVVVYYDIWDTTDMWCSGLR